MSSGSFFSNIPPVVKNLVIINLIMWLLCMTLTKHNFLGDFNLYDALTLHYWESEKFWPIQMFSYMFLHDRSGIAHVFFNMFSLWMLGSPLEARLGSKKFITFYVVCGLGAALVQQIVWSCQLYGMDVETFISSYRPDLYHITDMIENGQLNTNIHYEEGVIENAGQLRSVLLNGIGTVGASGAVFGIMIGFAMLFPEMPLYIMFIPVPIKAKYMMLIYAALELCFGVAASNDGIAHYAHLGGMIFAILMIVWWKKRNEI